jgi:leucyl-tRNA synthetase
MLLRCLYPVTPHMAQELWNGLGYAARNGRAARRTLARGRPGALVQDEVELMLQVNGKLRGAIRVPSGPAARPSRQAALANEMFVKLPQGAAPKKVIVVPGRLVNVVL